MLPSAVDIVQLRGRQFYIKRDDLIDPCLSGNKYRKLYTLIQTSATRYSKIVSYGGIQSNAMLALSCLCKAKEWHFEYHVKALPSGLKETPYGNLQYALENGMQLVEHTHAAYEQAVVRLSTDDAQTLVISQGGAEKMAEEGVKILANEINAFYKEEALKTLHIVLPSGTGTTALYLQHNVIDGIQVHTSVCVGDEVYQMQQWKKLSKGPYPHILKGPKKAFAKPDKEHLHMYQELLEATGIHFDLIYAPKTWLELLDSFSEDDNVIYVHTGGVSGNASMLARYRHLGLTQ